MEIEPLIGFLKDVENFKACERSCQTTNIGRAESDAEHSVQRIYKTRAPEKTIVLMIETAGIIPTGDA